MAENNWDEYGEQMKEKVDQAVRNSDFANLSKSVGDLINDAIDTVKGSVRDGHWESPYRRRQDESQTKPALYLKNPAGQGVGILMAVFGYIGLFFFGICFIACLTLVGMGFGLALIVTTVVFGVLTALSLWLGITGSRKMHMLNRYPRYIRILKDQSYIQIRKLSEQLKLPYKKTVQDLEKMIRSGWLLQAHIDKKDQCLIMSDEAYQTYIDARTDYLTHEQERKEQQYKEQQMTPEVRKILEDGQDYIDYIHACGDRISNTEAARKLDRMEDLITRIFDTVREHPEVAPDLKKMMEYYLPTTKKLLTVYEEMEDQPAAGENITSARTEIEATLDTLNTAFEKLFDQLFEDKAWDVSSDISVLNTILAQDGLK